MESLLLFLSSNENCNLRGSRVQGSPTVRKDAKKEMGVGVTKWVEFGCCVSVASLVASLSRRLLLSLSSNENCNLRGFRVQASPIVRKDAEEEMGVTIVGAIWVTSVSVTKIPITSTRPLTMEARYYLASSKKIICCPTNATPAKKNWVVKLPADVRPTCAIVHMERCSSELDNSKLGSTQ